MTLIFYGVSAIFLKSALLSLYLRIIEPVRTARILIWASLVIITLFYTICFVTDAVICGKFFSQPDISALDSSHFDPDDSCSVRQRPIWAMMSVFSVVSDFYLLIIPVILTMNLRLPLRRKIGVCCMFLTGFMFVISSLRANVLLLMIFKFLRLLYTRYSLPLSTAPVSRPYLDSFINVCVHVSTVLVMFSLGV